jgi:hypothetical protein
LEIVLGERRFVVFVLSIFAAGSGIINIGVSRP